MCVAQCTHCTYQLGLNGTARAAGLSLHRSYRKLNVRPVMQVLCALISPDPAKQRWLHLAGMVPLLQRLTLQRSLDTLGDGNLPALMAEPSALGLQRQSARMLALLASDPSAQPAISRSAWVSLLPPRPPPPFLLRA